ncbi:MAG: hypothetical protein HZB37_06555 [Planctomycetes bacterium]|nr:hypothetical protein [Planctomycetota bacterium]
MIAEMITSAHLTFSHIYTDATGEMAQYVTKQSNEGRRSLQSARSLGLGVMDAFYEIFEVAEQCKAENWDGYGAAPITTATFQQAINVLETLPLGTIAPTVGAEPDGHITLEWYKTPRRTLSVSISPEGELHYAALLGQKKRYGTEPFCGEVPDVIMDIIRQVET